MFSKSTLVLLAASVLAVCSVSSSGAQEFYYDLDTTYAVGPSPFKIAVQFDTTRPVPTQSEFIAAHSCLNASTEVKSLHRGFWIYGLQPSCGYAAAATELVSDGAVHRVVPVYMTTADSAEFKVSDLVDVQFDLDLPRESALALLAAHGLRFVDSSEYKHNLWKCALDDTIKASPLAYGNAMHVLPGVTWACARQYATPVLMSAPTDPYYAHQYYLKNTGQNGGVPGIDIAAEQAWRVPLSDSLLVIAVLDDGLVTHTELPTLRIRPGYDFAGDNLHPCQGCPPLPPDNDPRPGTYKNHGMACAGILAASHNGTGVAGVFGSCKVIPVKIFDNYGTGADTIPVADAIRYAWREGARVISNSWGYGTTEPYAVVANAIRDVSNGRGRPGLGKNPEAALGCVMIFAAGNGADGGPDGPAAVHFPANMPEVIAVGAVKNTGARWDYSSYGSALDVVAPSGNDGDGVGDPSTASNQWTVDQMGDLGWNPHVTGAGDAYGDQNYTSAMGGTSGACPQVAGIAALLMARGHADISPYHPYEKIREIITRTATDMGTAGWDQYYGYGRANAYRAMLSIIHGDVNNDGVIDVADVIMTINIAFSGGSAVLDDGTADVNCDGGVDVFDVIQIIAVAFSGGLAPICYY